MSDPSEVTAPSDRLRFLDRISRRQSAPPENGVHPAPAPPSVVPEVRSRHLDGSDGGDTADLLAVFGAQAELVDAVVHVGEPDDAIAQIVAQTAARRAVVSPEPGLVAVADLLIAGGVDVDQLGRDTAAGADLGVTGAVAGIASTGSVVIDADLVGGRLTSLLPRVHVCVLRREDIVADTGDVFRRSPRPLPRHRVVVTGPSRTGDIEQILTLGAHGPVALHIIVC